MFYILIEKTICFRTTGGLQASQSVTCKRGMINFSPF